MYFFALINWCLQCINVGNYVKISIRLWTGSIVRGQNDSGYQAFMALITSQLLLLPQGIIVNCSALNNVYEKSIYIWRYTVCFFCVWLLLVLSNRMSEFWLHRHVTWENDRRLTLASVRTRALSVWKGLHGQATWRNTWGLTQESVRTLELDVGSGLHRQITWRNTWGSHRRASVH